MYKYIDTYRLCLTVSEKESLLPFDSLRYIMEDQVCSNELHAPVPSHPGKIPQVPGFPPFQVVAICCQLGSKSPQAQESCSGKVPEVPGIPPLQAAAICCWLGSESAQAQESCTKDFQGLSPSECFHNLKPPTLDLLPAVDTGGAKLA